MNDVCMFNLHGGADTYNFPFVHVWKLEMGNLLVRYGYLCSTYIGSRKFVIRTIVSFF